MASKYSPGESSFSMVCSSALGKTDAIKLGEEESQKGFEQIARGGISQLDLLSQLFLLLQSRVTRIFRV